MNKGSNALGVHFAGAYPLLTLCLLLTLSSCSLLKHKSTSKLKTGGADSTIVTNQPPHPDTSVITSPTVPRADSIAATPPVDSAAIIAKVIDKVTPIWQKRMDYRTFSGKAKLHFESLEGEHDFTANFRIRKDSVIWINITAFGGLPAARIFITRDSFFMTIPLQQQAKRLPLSEAAKVLPTRVDFASMQNLLVGEPLRDGTITWAAEAGDSLSLVAEDSAYIQQITYNTADSTIRNGQLDTRTPNGPRAATTYTDYKLASNRRVSMERAVVVQNKDDIYLLQLVFSGITFDEALEYPFSIPKNYKVK
jgi:hypothetical protein